MAGKPKIFISHSSDDDADDGERRWAREIREELTARLSASYDVLIDRTGLKAGRSWRNAINGWLGACDGAITLLSSKALESAWVGYEVSVLAFRKQQAGDGFAVVPVHLAQAGSFADWPRVDPTQLLEGQGIDGHFVETWDAPAANADRVTALERVCADVAAALDGLVPSDAPPVARAIRQVTAALQTVAQSGEHEISQSIDELGDAVEGWGRCDEDVEHLARCMVTLGLCKNVAKCLRRLAPKLGPEGLCNIIDALASSWVDLRAVELVKGAAAASRVVASNVEHADTAWFYMWAQADMPPSQSWKVAPVVWAPRADDADGEALIEAIDISLRDVLRRDTRADVIEKLEDMAFADDRVFATVRHDGLDAPLLDRVLDVFPELCLFLFDSDRVRAASTVVNSAHADRIFLAPDVERDDESHYRDVRRKLRNVFDLGNST